jgi:hypothetical protein
MVIACSFVRSLRFCSKDLVVCGQAVNRVPVNEEKVKLQQSLSGVAGMLKELIVLAQRASAGIGNRQSSKPLYRSTDPLAGVNEPIKATIVYSEYALIVFDCV